MIIKSTRFLLLFLFIGVSLQAQSFWFGPKGGPALSTQKWSNFSPNSLITFNGDFNIESYKEDSPSSVYAQIGYHTRGSSIRTFTLQGANIGNQGFKFRNIVLELGAKRIVKLNKKFVPYYGIGLRLEYTVDTNLKDYERFNSLYYPNDAFVDRFVYGPSLNGGFEWTDYAEYFRPYLELSIQPDVSEQYTQGPINNVEDQFGNIRNIGARAIRNLTFEVKVGFKFLRKVEYID